MNAQTPSADPSREEPGAARDLASATLWYRYWLFGWIFEDCNRGNLFEQLFGAFGDGHRTHAVWAGVAPNERLSVLAGRCRSAAERAAISIERRDYRPHLTLAYLDARADPARIGNWIADHNLLQSPPIRIERFGLYSSVLAQGGSRYDLEREYVL